MENKKENPFLTFKIKQCINALEATYLSGLNLLKIWLGDNFTKISVKHVIPPGMPLKDKDFQRAIMDRLALGIGRQMMNDRLIIIEKELDGQDKVVAYRGTSIIYNYHDYLKESKENLSG